MDARVHGHRSLHPTALMCLLSLSPIPRSGRLRKDDYTMNGLTVLETGVSLFFPSYEDALV